MDQDIRHYARVMCDERKLAQAAPSEEAAEFHRQLMMLYKLQFRLLMRKRRRTRPAEYIAITSVVPPR